MSRMFPGYHELAPVSGDVRFVDFESKRASQAQVPSRSQETSGTYQVPTG